MTALQQPLEAPLAPAAAAPVAELVALVVLSLVMVALMIRFSAAAVEPRRRPAGTPIRPRALTPTQGWGLLYGLSWIGLGVAIVRLLAALGKPVNGKDAAFVLLGVAGWFAFNAGWILLVRALLRANARSAGLPDPFSEGPAPPAPAPGDPQRLEEEDEELGEEGGIPSEEGYAAEAEPEVAQPAVTAKEAPPAPPLWKRALGWVGTIAAVLFVIVLGEALPPWKALEAFLAARQPAFLAVTISLAAAGLLLLVGGGVALALAQGRPLSPREIEEMERRRREAAAGPAVARAGVARHWGTTAGAGGEEQVSFREMKVAFRERAWRANPRWRRIFVMAAGAALMFTGIWGTVFVLAPAGLKLLVAAIVLYPIVRIARGFARA